MTLTAAEIERYARHIILPEIGGPGQMKLKQARVLVIGAGGLGAPLLLYLAAAGCGVMVTPSRRTPAALTTALAKALEGKPAFVWDGTGSNPYAAMIALADSIVVTGDSVNMVGEALASGVPVQVYEPSGGHRKITGFIDKLVAAGHVRRWAGGLERWDNPPVDATSVIAGEIARRYNAFRASPMG